MAEVIRQITDDQCEWFATDMAALDHELGRILDRHNPLCKSEWIGGDANERAPVRTTEAMELVRQARALLKQADHLVAMFRVTGDDDSDLVVDDNIP